MRISLCLLFCALSSLTACKSTAHESGAAADAKQSAAKKSADKSAEKSGVFMPSVFSAVALWPEEYSGGLLVLEVAPQGTTVQEGDVLARLDPKAIDEALHSATLEVRSAEVRHQALLAKNQIEEEAAASALQRSQAGVERARRALEGWKSQELAFSRRSDELQKKWEEAGVDDQKDELGELEKMYKADELVDGTEDIVLKRAQRRLALTLDGNGISRDRARYHTELELALELERRTEGLREQEESLAHLVRSQEIERGTRQDAALRSADALAEEQKKLAALEKDRELFTVRAPRAGVLLHGSAEDYRPDSTPPRYHRADQLALRKDVFLVADPNPTAVALEIQDSELATFLEGGAVSVKPLGTDAGEAQGVLARETYPRKLGGSERVFDATVQLEQPLEGVLYGTRAAVTIAGAQAKAGG